MSTIPLQISISKFFKPFTMQQDSLLQIVNSTTSFTTSDVVGSFLFAAACSDVADSELVLNRFVVQSLTHCKDTEKAPFHEFLAIEIMDTQNSGGKPYFMILERTASESRETCCGTADSPASGSFVKLLLKEASVSVSNLLRGLRK